MSSVKLTKAEKEAISALEDLAKVWPKSLILFARADRLNVLKPGDNRTFGESVVGSAEIYSDGGDPNDNDVMWPNWNRTSGKR